MQQNTDEMGTYLVKGTAGNKGEPGAPSLQFTLIVNAGTGAITGQGQITQAIKPPGDKTRISDITGYLQASSVGEYAKLVYFAGSAEVPFPPPAIGIGLVRFHAEFAINDGWTGKGGWTLGQDAVNNVPVSGL